MDLADSGHLPARPKTDSALRQRSGHVPAILDIDLADSGHIPAKTPRFWPIAAIFRPSSGQIRKNHSAAGSRPPPKFQRAQRTKFHRYFRRQQRAPMKSYQDAGPEFRNSANTPAPEPLLQEPPRSAEAGNTGLPSS